MSGPADILIPVTTAKGVKKQISASDLPKALELNATVDGTDADGLVPMVTGKGIAKRIAPADVAKALGKGATFAQPAMPEPAQVEAPPAAEPANVYDPLAEAEKSVAAGLDVDVLPFAEREAYAKAHPEAHTSALDKGRAFFEGTARGVTLGARTPMEYAEGASNWLGNKAYEAMNPGARQVGFDESLSTAQRDITDRENANKYTSAAGQIYGAVVPALAGGALASRAGVSAAKAAATVGAGEAAAGGSTAATGGSALLRAASLTPAGLVSRAAAAAGAEAGKRIAAETAWKIAAGGTALAVTGAIEGGAIGAIHEVDMAAESGDWDSIAEKAWAGLKEGALVGSVASLAVGGAVGLGQKAYGAAKNSRVVTAAKDWIDQIDQTVPGVADDIASAAPQAADNVASPVAGAADDTAFRPGLADVDPVAAQEARGPLVSVKAPEAQKRLKTLLRSAGNGIDETYAKATRSIRSDMDELLKSQNVIDERAGIAAKRAASEAYNVEGAKVGMQEVSPALANTRQRLADIIEEYGEPALQSRGGLTTVKYVQSAIKSAEKRVAAKLEAGEVGDAYMALDDLKRSLGQAQATKNPLVEDVMQREYQQLQQFLEDDTVWGELALRQRAANPAWTERIRRLKDQRMGSFFVRSGDAAENPFEQLTQSNDSVIAGFIRKLGDDGNDGAEEALRRYLRASALDAQARANAWGSQAMREQAAKVRANAARIEDTLDAVAAARRGAQKWQTVSKAVEGVPFAEAAVKGVGSVARKIGAIGGDDALDSVARATVETRKAAIAAQKRLDVAAGLKKILANNGPAARNVVRQATTLRAVEKRVAALDEASDDERQMGDAIQRIGGEHPELGDAVWRQNEMRKAYLLQKLGPQPMDQFGRPRARSKVELQQFKKVLDAVDDPLGAIERMSEGNATDEDQEALQTLYPSMRDEFIAKAMDSISEKTPYKKRILISQALGVPVDDTLAPDFVIAMQQSAQSNVGQDAMQKASGAANPGAGMETKAERLSTR